MLDAETKRRIDTARDILVGKVPDPKSQVEQITIALIYKFMDDIDSQSEVMGGKRSFFAGDFARYGWARLMRSGLGGHDILNLYAEAITRMPENPGIPPLFRDIFNNAYLPYRDPETLRAFLKVIDEFEYDHSERLGDAFEYLLSVMGAQGDAGQFRTPRHVIDFIVAVIDPKKHETVLDPACGTAGFLISSYKHILAANTDADGQSTLTPDEKGRLVGGVSGYDISPDMVRLSLVNMYLHGFADPHIQEYDTLTSDERWNEYADVILANPPFMSPKGGIRPHNRFSVTSRRSEVLFVDYMAEHLTPSGRAGIIVPEGIIFQSQRAHTQLRKLLVEEFLVAVISLPAGVFKPYSGVKTSILILDRALARRTDRIAFFKVENDGFDLGDQRRPIDKNDLPQTAEALKQYLNMDGQDIQDGEIKSSSSCPSMLDDLIRQGTALLVPKEKIAADGDYNLSGERYRETGLRIGRFPLVRIGDVCAINPRKTELAALDSEIPVSFVPMADLNENQMTFQPCKTKVLSEVSPSYTYFADNDVLLARVTPCFENGKAGVARGLVNGIGFGSSEFYVLRFNDRALPEWIYFCVTHPQFRDSAILQMTGTGGLQRVPRHFVENFSIPLPQLEVQREIVAEVEGYQKVIDGARAVIENYRPHVPIDPEWPTVRVGDLCETGRGRVISRRDVSKNPGPYPVYSSQTSNGGLFGHLGTFDFDGEYVTWTTDGANAGTVFHRTGKFNCTNVCGTLKRRVDAVHRIDMRFLAQVLGQVAKSYVIQVGNPKLMNKEVAKIPVSVPSLRIQEAVVREIEAEKALVNANRELIERFMAKIQAVVGRVWSDGGGCGNDNERDVEPLERNADAVSTDE